MVNEASFSVNGYVATQPKLGTTRGGDKTLYMRVGWTPRRLDRTTGEWADQATSFVSVTCYRKVAENAGFSLRRGDPVVVKGTLRVREYGEGDGPKRNSVEVAADSIGHDLSRGVSVYRRSNGQLEQTAYELQQQSAAALGNGPLPGDGPSEDRLAFSGAGAVENGLSTAMPGARYPAGASYPAGPDYLGESDPDELADLEEDLPSGNKPDAGDADAGDADAGGSGKLLPALEPGASA